MREKCAEEEGSGVEKARDEVRVVWQRWYRDSDGKHRCDYGIANEPLNADQVKIIENEINSVSSIRPVLIFFDVYRRNYSDLVRAYEDVATELGNETYSRLDLRAFATMAVFQHRVLNFLNAASLMIERVKSHLLHAENVEKFELDAVAKVENRAFDEFAS